MVDHDDNVTGYALGMAAAHGVVAINAQTGQFTYTPAANFHGEDSFSIVAIDDDGQSVDVAISVAVNSVNDAPTQAALAAGETLQIAEGARGRCTGRATGLDRCRRRRADFLARQRCRRPLRDHQ